VPGSRAGADIGRALVLGDPPVQVGELEDLRDERVGDLERGLPLAADAELHGTAGGRALRDREARPASPGEERQLDPAARRRRAGSTRSDRGQLEAVEEGREPPYDSRGGCQLTWASTRIAVCPWPAPATSTTRSRRSACREPEIARTCGPMTAARNRHPRA